MFPDISSVATFFSLIGFGFDSKRDMKFANHVSTRMKYCSGSLKLLPCLQNRNLHLAPPFLVEDHVPVAVDTHRNGLLKVFIHAISNFSTYTKYMISNASMVIMSLPAFIFIGEGGGG